MGLDLGYKQTEVGVIPEEWDCETVGHLVQTGDLHKPMDGNHGNLHPKSEDYVSFGIPFVMANNIRNGKVDLINCSYIRKEQADSLQKGFSLPGDVLLTHKATIGNTAVVGEIPFEYIMLTPQVTYYRIANEERLNNRYLQHYFDGSTFQKTLITLSGGGTRSYIGITAQLQLPIVIPPLTEQEAVADVLSDATAFIESLEQLVAKKHRLKRGAMHELLTGKRRLPGFSGEWKPGVMSDYFDLITTRNEELNDNVVTISAQQGFVRQEEFFKKRVASNVLSNYYLLERGQFAYNRSYSNGYPFGAVKLLSKFEKAVVTTLYICFRPKSGAPVCPPFFEQYFEAGLLNKGLASVANEGGRAHGLLNVTKADFFSRPVKVPSYDEQHAIAAALSDMDAEISALEAKLAKARRLKQGMMHNLLTGSIRLI